MRPTDYVVICALQVAYLPFGVVLMFRWENIERVALFGGQNIFLIPRGLFGVEARNYGRKELIEDNVVLDLGHETMKTLLLSWGRLQFIEFIDIDILGGH